ncbi:LacI family transcriptional regulator [Paenibacillus ginsengarvi]|uniref:LacI family transcriptional regulator n=1 Tax=Paenibacillus ginsengarvi TaxID=400777 RepID=A0A3B0CHA1_9BACL|nr:LacI family transcriptional regulator [Paenibacillus ginsengarvi]
MLLEERKNKVVTLKDIADAAGVTTATVSRALNDGPGVKPATRDKIMAIARQLNYFSGSPAKRVSGTKPNSIGIIWSYAYGLFFNHVCLELQRQAALRGYYSLVSFAPPDEALLHMNEHGIDKVFFWCGPGWKPSLEFLQEKQRFHGEMLVVGGGSIEGAHRLSIDRVGAIKKAIHHLAELGHKRIAFVGASSEKLVGYTLGLLENRLEYDPEFFVQPLNGSMPEQQIAKLLVHNDKPQRPTAVIVDSHGYLFPFLQTIRKLKLSVPEHFSLVAYELIPELEKLLEVPITAVGPRYERLAERSLDLLLSGAGGQPEGHWQDLMLETELIVRESTASPQE